MDWFRRLGLIGLLWVGVLCLAAGPSWAAGWCLWPRRGAANAQPRVVHPIGYEGQYEYNLGAVPTFRYGYFGAHSRPMNSWSPNNYYQTHKQWTFQPGS